MPVGKQFVAHLVFTGNGNAAPTTNRNWRCTVARPAPGRFVITTDDDTPEQDLEAVLSASANGNVQDALAVLTTIRRTAANTYELNTYVAGAAVAADPAANTIVRCTINRVDTV